VIAVTISSVLTELKWPVIRAVGAAVVTWIGIVVWLFGLTAVRMFGPLSPEQFHPLAMRIDALGSSFE
jgi:hypothetical protein